MLWIRDLKFTKDLKKLKKKYKKITNDLEVFQEIHSEIMSREPKDDVRINFFKTLKATQLHRTDQTVQIVKARLDSKDLNNNSIRVIYCYCQTVTTEPVIILIEIYAKSLKQTEDKLRWRKYKKLSLQLINRETDYSSK